MGFDLLILKTGSPRHNDITGNNVCNALMFTRPMHISAPYIISKCSNFLENHIQPVRVYKYNNQLLEQQLHKHQKTHIYQIQLIILDKCTITIQR